MKTIVLLSIFSLVILGDHPEKHSDLLEWGINGRVKSIKMYAFNYHGVENDSIEVDTFNLENWDRFVQTYYNHEGMTDSMVIYNYREMPPLKYITDYLPDVAITNLIYEKDTTLFSKTYWTDKFNYRMDIYDGGKLKNRNTTRLNKDFSVREVHYELIDPENQTVYHEIKDQVYFNDQLQLDSIVTSSENNVNNVTINKDIAIDSAGNPIKSIKNYNNEKQLFIIRKIEYY